MTARDTISHIYSHVRARAGAETPSLENAVTWRHWCHRDRLNELAGQVARLSPDRRDPERYHIEKSEIVADLRRLARAMGAGK